VSTAEREYRAALFRALASAVGDQHLCPGDNCYVPLESACAMMGYLAGHERNIRDSDRMDALEDYFTRIHPPPHLICWARIRGAQHEGENVRATVDKYLIPADTTQPGEEDGKR